MQMRKAIGMAMASRHRESDEKEEERTLFDQGKAAD
jgi:hypothetical protein